MSVNEKIRLIWQAQTILRRISPFSRSFSMSSRSWRLFAGRTIPSGNSNDPSVTPLDCSAANIVCSNRVCWRCCASMADSFDQTVFSDTGKWDNQIGRFDRHVKTNQYTLNESEYLQRIIRQSWGFQNILVINCHRRLILRNESSTGVVKI